MERSKLEAVIVLIIALLVGAAGSQGCATWRQHNAQHAQAEADHLLLQQIVNVLNQQLQAAPPKH